MIIIVVGSSIDNIMSQWVQYEWESFHRDILSGIKENGEIITYVTPNVGPTDLPRSLRGYQCFQTDKTKIHEIVDFVKKYLSKKNAENKDENYGLQKRLSAVIDTINEKDNSNRSNYSANYGNEFMRLEIQANNSFDHDKVGLNYIKRRINKISGLNVLDVGSAYGFVAYSRFNDDPSINQVICIDNNDEVIKIAKKTQNGLKLKFFKVDIEADDFEEILGKVFESCSIEKVDIVFSALTIHHLDNPDRFLRRIRKFIIDEGFIYLRGSDDSSKICYPHSDCLKEIVTKYLNAKGTSDRLNGQKLYTQLRNAGFNDIKIFSLMTDTSQRNMEEKEQLFEESFNYRINNFRKRLEEDLQNRQKAEEYEWMKAKLKEMENYFYEPNFWYAEYNYIGIGQK